VGNKNCGETKKLDGWKQKMLDFKKEMIMGGDC
jgi:hypothetical protein